MITKLSDWCSLAVIAAAGVGLSTVAFGASPGEEITLNATTGDYTITYCDPDQPPPAACSLEQATFTPATKIDPRLKSFFAIRDASFTIAYRYFVMNNLTSRQSLIQFVLDPVSDVVSPVRLPKTLGPTDEQTLVAEVSALPTVLGIPAGWDATVIASRIRAGLRIGWGFKNVPDNNAGLRKGTVQGGFGFTSKDLPGIVAGQLSGNANLTSFDDDGPTGDIGGQFNQLSTHDFVSRFTATPTIPVPVPFDRAEMVRRIDREVNNWVGMQLLDSVLFQQVDGFLQSAINAANLNDQVSFMAALGKVRNLIRNIYPTVDESETDWTDQSTSPLISRLAARVLLFDIFYATTHP